MTRSSSKYKRCKKCKQLVLDPDDCQNCANRDPMGFHRGFSAEGKRGAPTLDIQEGNWEEWN